MNSRSNMRSLSKEEILDTIDMILNLLADKEDYRPRMAEELNNTVLKLKGEAIPPIIESELREHEMEMDMFMKAIETLCEDSFPKEYKRLRDCHPDILRRVLRNGEARSDLVLLRRKLELNESVSFNPLAF